MTDTDVANLALAWLGSYRTANLATDTGVQATTVRALLHHTRKELLEDTLWNFAHKLAALTLSTEEPLDFTYAYHMPSDCLKPLKIRVPGTVTLPEPIAFKKRLNATNTGHLILTEMEDAQLYYTCDLREWALMTDKFIEAVALKIAEKAAPTLAPSTQRSTYLNALARTALMEAREEDAVSSVEDLDEPSDWIGDRE